MISVLLMKNPCCKLIFFVLSVLRQAATVCYLEKWQKLTRDDLKARRWLPSPHCPERFQEQATPKAQQSPPSLSLPFSVHLSQDGQSFPLLNTAGAQGDRQEDNAFSSKNVNKESLCGTRKAAQETCTCT